MSKNQQSSQTAPIDEYRVLWTAQKKQKLKKWHDGFLRFHKFNKRLLVYDDSRHLVADMYLRGRDTIGEGDDLEFENHLVTVEDFKGTLVQDLTPLFTSGVKRKQQIQAGNNLINPETPNQANRHGPWGPSSRNTTPTLHEGPMTTAVKFPQTPMQRRPTNTNISLQQSIWRNNNIKHPHPYQDRPQAQAQNRPTKVGPLPPPKPNVTPNPNPQIQQLWRSGPRRPDTSGFSTSRRPPLNTLDGPPSPNGRINQPPKQAIPTEPAQDHRTPTGHKNAPLYSASSHVDRRPLDLNGFSDVVRPLKPSLPQIRPINIFSSPAPVNKSTPDVAIDTDSDDELFGSLPDFNNRASPPLAQKADLEPVCASKRSLDASKNPGKNSRAFKPPSTRNAVTFPNKTSSTSRAALSSTGTREGSNSRTFQSLPNHKSTIDSSKPSLVVAVDSIPITGSGGGGEKEKGPFEPLVSAGTILLGGAAKRKRSKLLCQRPSSASPKEPSAGIRERESTSKRPRKEPPSKLPSSPTVVERAAENSMATAGASGDAPIPSPPTVKKGLSAFKFQPPKKVHESKGGDKGKGVTDHMQYRIEEKADTIEYQKEHDIGPWSSEAFDLFGWRPPSTRERK